jgi:hypothetical protein
MGEIVMIRVKSLAISSTLVVVLTVCLLPQPARADDSSSGREGSIHLYAKEFAGPIGEVQALTPVSINGRAGRGQQFIWSGEMVQALNASIHLEFYQLGRVTLGRSAATRFASARSGDEDGNSCRVLIASLVAGEIALKLMPETAAYVEAGGSAFTASRGATFKLGVKEGQVMLTTISGEVRTEALPQSDLKIQFVDDLGRPVASGAKLSVRARSTRQVHVRVTDKNDRPVPDMPVVFLLGGQGGTLGSGASAVTSVTVATNAQGVAAASFTAGPASASTSVTATVAGTGTTATMGVTTTAAGILAGTKLGLIAAAVAGGTVATVVVVKQVQDNKEPITALPPTITPRP